MDCCSLFLQRLLEKAINFEFNKVRLLLHPFTDESIQGERFAESSQNEIVLRDVRHATFLVLLEYLYTDHVEVPLEVAMELFQAADQFGVERLKKICESKMLGSICVDNAAQIFHVLRRQVLRKWRKPLVIMSPKSLLRSPLAATTLNELSEGRQEL